MPSFYLQRGMGPGELRASAAAQIALVLAVILVYAQAVGFDYMVIDDTVYLSEKNIHKGLTRETLWWALSSNVHSNWHPLTVLSHIISFQIFGLHPAGHHAVNVLLHILSTVVLFRVLRAMASSVFWSFVAASLFALHPLNVESVAWIAERKGALSTVFWMLALWAYVGYARRPSRLRYALVLAAFVMGLMSKQMLVTLPVVLLLLDYWPLERLRPGGGLAGIGSAVREKVPLFILSIGFAAIAYMGQSMGGAVASTASVPLGPRAANAISAYTVYLRRMLPPFDLGVFYPYDFTPDVLPVIASAAAIAAISALAVLARIKRPYIFVGWFWYAVTLLPVSQIVQLGRHSTADRYMYIPMIGIVLVVVFALAELARGLGGHGRAVRLSVAGALLLLGLQAWQQASYWKNSVTILGRTLQVTEDNYVAYTYLGYALMPHSHKAALSFLDKAIEINPYYEDALTYKGTILLSGGDARAALPLIELALKVRPRHVEALNALGRALAATGRTEEAIGAYERALREAPGNEYLHNNLGSAYIEAGRPDLALVEFETALRINPGFRAAAENRAGVDIRLMDARPKTGQQW